ncbi:MAG: AAA family ATPase [Acidithiobacillales bacterium]
MPIVFICSVPFGGGERLAQSLAAKLGYAYLSREDVVAKANECGIPVGKLEVAMVKKPAVRERLARLKQRYLAVATDTICEKAAQGDLVYYGRAGHFLLPGVSHVLRVRVIPEHGQRLDAVVSRTKLSREKAEVFLSEIDDDIRAWVHFVHGADMDDLRKYDFVVNLENVSLENAATALCGIVDLPDFKPTPASRRAMEELLLQARARIRLALDERTAEADLTVRSSEGVVTITYMPRQASLAPLIPGVLEGLPGCREVRCTVASTNILWIQEEFRPDSGTLTQINELARRWGAAVELIRYRPEGGGEAPLARPATGLRVTPADGGVEEDVVEKVSPAERAFRETLERLVHDGRSGGGQTVAGGPDRLLAAVHPDISYSLVVLGDVFLDKPAAARTRMGRDLANFLAGKLRSPVIGTGELSAKLRFGAGQIAKVAAALLVVVVVYVLVFRNQGPLLDLLGGPSHKARPWVAPVLVALIAPLVAGLYGLVASTLLRLIRLE